MVIDQVEATSRVGDERDPAEDKDLARYEGHAGADLLADVNLPVTM